MTRTRDIGDRGESAAANYLESRGFTILDRNWRHGRDELDVVARRGGTVHFVEVKCRKSGALTPPEQAVTARKFGALQRAARAWIEARGFDGEVQFDLVAVDHDGTDCRVRYIPNAMYCRW